MNENIVVTGVGFITSLGNLEDTFKALVEGRSGMSPIEGFPAEGFKAKYAARVKGLDAADLGISGREQRITDTHTLMLMKCAREAFASIGEGVPRDEVAFFAGMGCVDYRVDDLLPAIRASLAPEGSLDYGKFYGGAFREIYPLWPLGMLNNIAFCQADIALALRGENTVLTPHAESGAQALWEAALSVAEGRAPAALAAGVSEKVSPMSLARETIAGVLSNDICRPFSALRDGTAMGEGAAAFLIAAESSAKKKGAPPIARIAGYGEAFSYKSESAPDSEAIARAMRTALSVSGLKPSDIDVLIAHAEGSPEGDNGEIEAINDVFARLGESSEATGCGVKVYSSKGALGHMLAASPAVDAALAIKIIETGTIPPTLNAEPLDARIKFEVVREAVKADVRRVMVSCAGRLGHCASLIVEAA